MFVFDQKSSVNEQFYAIRLFYISIYHFILFYHKGSLFGGFNWLFISLRTIIGYGIPIFKSKLINSPIAHRQ